MTKGRKKRKCLFRDHKLQEVIWNGWPWNVLELDLSHLSQTLWQGRHLVFFSHLSHVACFQSLLHHTLVMCTTIESATATLLALDSSWQFFLYVYPYLDLYPMVEVPLFIINQPVVSTRTAFLHHPLLLTSLEICWFALWAQGTPNLALFLISVGSIRNY